MEQCSYCDQEINDGVYFCPHCGRHNTNDIFVRMSRINERMATGTATNSDYEYVKAVQEEVRNYKPPDFRTPFEKMLNKIGWVVFVALIGYLLWVLWGEGGIELVMMMVFWAISAFAVIKIYHLVLGQLGIDLLNTPFLRRIIYIGFMFISGFIAAALMGLFNLW